MNFMFTDEQTMIRNSIHEYFSESYDFNNHICRIEKKIGVDQSRWEEMASLGWIGLAVDEKYGGSGGTAEELMLLMEGCGHYLCVEPLFATAVLGAPLLSALGEDASRETIRILEQVIAGKASLALAWSESPRSFAPLAIKTKAELKGNGEFVLSGHKVMVENGGSADWIIIPAQVEGRDKSTSLSLFLVPRTAEHMNCTPTTVSDGSNAADLKLNNVTVPAESEVATSARAESLLLEAAYRGQAARCAEALGAMGAVLQLCRSYLLEREQFGRSLASFQVLQHRFVDLLRAEERSRSMTYLAAIRAKEIMHDDSDALRDIHMAKIIVGSAARLIGSEAIQLHGGMGMAYEYPAGHYYRKLLWCDFSLGTSDEHLTLLSHPGLCSAIANRQG